MNESTQIFLATSLSLTSILLGVLGLAVKSQCESFSCCWGALLLLGRASLVGLMEERDAVLAHNIRRACQGEGGREVVVVLGAAHVNGVRRLLMQS